MSSISSHDSYHISVEDDEPYIRKLDEFESASGSDSDNGSIEINKITFKDAERMLKKCFETENNTNELDVISLYLKCKQNLFKIATQQYKTYSNILFISSLLFSGSLVFLPFFSTEKTAISTLGLLSISCISLSRYCNFDVNSDYYNNISHRYGKLHLNIETFLAKLVYFSSKTEKQTIFYEKTREIENKLYDFKEENVCIPESIRVLVPILSSINIFSSIHNVEIHQKRLINRYKNVKNEIEYLLCKKNGNTLVDKEKIRMEFLVDNKKKIKDELKKMNYLNIKEFLEYEYKTHLIKYG